MRILGIETSCDETAAAVVENGTKILSNVVASSIELHKKTGGIIPEVAAREQIKYIIPVIEKAIIEAFSGQRLASRKKLNASPYPLDASLIDAIAVTVGPGLIGSLLVGVETAKTLAHIWEKPIVPVNHLQAHLYANWLKLERESKRAEEQELPEFPALGLVVSGGHTDLVLMKNPHRRADAVSSCVVALLAFGERRLIPAAERRGIRLATDAIKDHSKIKWLGGTRDDAAGECFDKTARVLGLSYPGGPEIAKLAGKGLPAPSRRAEADGKAGNPQAYDLPRPMIKQKNLDFSFSGLKTAVVNRVKEQESKRIKINIADMAAGIQQAIIDVLVEKTIRAAKKHKVKSVLLAGGVAANRLLRKQLASELSNYKAIKFFVPSPKLCTDNATYIASCAFFNFKPIPWQKIEVNPDLGIAEASIDKT